MELGIKGYKELTVTEDLLAKNVGSGLVAVYATPMMIAGNDKPGFKIDLHIKDLNNALDCAHTVGSPLPMTAAVQEIFQWLHNNGCGQDDHSSIIKYYKKLTGIESL